MADPAVLIQAIREFQDELHRVATASGVSLRDATQGQQTLLQGLTVNHARCSEVGNTVADQDHRLGDTYREIAAIDGPVDDLTTTAAQQVKRALRVEAAVRGELQRAQAERTRLIESIDAVKAKLKVAKDDERRRLQEELAALRTQLERCERHIANCQKALQLVRQAQTQAMVAQQEANNATSHRDQAVVAAARAQTELRAADSALDVARQAMVGADDHAEAARQHLVQQQEAQAVTIDATRRADDDTEAAVEHLRAIDEELM